MIEVSVTPKNSEHFARLMSFAREVLDVCDRVNVTPVLDGSLAVLAYAGDPSMEVHDIDFSCPESEFPRLQQALEAVGVECKVTSWHVLQARRGDMKIEFGATEYWAQDLPEHHEDVRIGDVQICTVGIDGLREMYRRGFVDTAGKEDDGNRLKHRTYREKLRLLGAPES